MPDDALVAAALDILPPGIRWAWMMWTVPTAFAVSWVLSRMASGYLLRPLRQARIAAAALGDRLHWTEEARLAWPLRQGAVRVPISLAFVLAVAVPLGDSALDPIHPVARALLLAGVCLIGGGLGAGPAFAEALPDLPRGWAAQRSSFASLIARLGHLVLLLGLAAGLPGDAHPAVVVGAIALSLALTTAWRRGAGVDLARVLGLAHAADARLMGIVAQAAQALGRPMPRVQILDWMMVNAFAFPGANRLVFTRAACDRMDEAALSGVAMHELGHLAEGPKMLRLRAMQPLMLLPVVAIKPAWFHLGSLGTLGAVLLWFVGVVLARRFLVARMQAAETEADGVAGHGHENGAYALVLEQIYALNKVPAVLGQKRVHPELYDRMRDLGVEPDWPRPEAPSTGPARLVGLATLFGAFGALAVFFVALQTMLGMDRVGLGAVVLSNASSAALIAHGRTRAANGDAQEGAVLMRLACAQSGRALQCAESALWLAELGRCEEAWEDQEQAEWDLELEGESLDGQPQNGSAAYVGEARRWVERCDAAPSPGAQTD